MTNVSGTNALIFVAVPVSVEDSHAKLEVSAVISCNVKCEIDHV